MPWGLMTKQGVVKHECPRGRTRNNRPSRRDPERSHAATLPLSAPVRMKPLLGSTAMLCPDGCPLRVSMTEPEARSHTLAAGSNEPPTMLRPSGVNRMSTIHAFAGRSSRKRCRPVRRSSITTVEL